jgi:hypothetical protein
MGWRDKYKVHPAADVFPMMTEEELAATGADIMEHGLKEPIAFWDANRGTPQFERFLIDGRNRMEAMERVGLDLRQYGKEYKKLIDGDPVAYIISKNIHRRHLTKLQQAEFIVAARSAAPRVSRQDGGKPQGGRPADELKAEAIADGKAMDISERTIERALRKKKGKPKPKTDPKPKPKPKAQDQEARAELAEAELADTKRHLADLEDAVAKGGIDSARARYAAAYAQLDPSERSREMEILSDSLRKAVAYAA